MYGSNLHQLQTFLMLIRVHMKLDFTPPEKSMFHFLYFCTLLFVFQQICICKLVNLWKLIPSTGHNVRETFSVWEKPCHRTNEDLCKITHAVEHFWEQPNKDGFRGSGLEKWNFETTWVKKSCRNRPIHRFSQFS